MHATPCDGARDSVGAAARDIGLRTPNAAAMEKSSVDEVDHNKLRAGAFANLARKARRDPDAVAVGAAPCDSSVSSVDEERSFILRMASLWLPRCDKLECLCGGHGAARALARTSRADDRAASADMDTVQYQLWELMETDLSRVKYVMYPGRRMMNQFEPWFFGVAFPFCFKYGVGMPDMPEWTENARHRRGPAAPRVDLAMWARIMTRRVESQFRREWRFGFRRRRSFSKAQ